MKISYNASYDSQIKNINIEIITIMRTIQGNIDDVLKLDLIKNCQHIENGVKIDEYMAEIPGQYNASQWRNSGRRMPQSLYKLKIEMISDTNEIVSIKEVIYNANGGSYYYKNNIELISIGKFPINAD